MLYSITDFDLVTLVQALQRLQTVLHFYAFHFLLLQGAVNLLSVCVHVCMYMYDDCVAMHVISAFMCCLIM